MPKDKEGTPQEESTTEPRPTDPGGRLDPERLKASAGGDPNIALQRLAYKLDEVERDNANYRQRIRDLEGAQPEEGSVVLSGEDAATYKALLDGRTLKDTATLVASGQDALAKLAERESEDRLRTVAEATGARLSVLKLAPGVKDLSFKVEQNGEGKTVKVEYDKDGKASTETFGDFAKREWPDLVDVLFEPTNTSPQQRYIRQSPGGQDNQRRVDDKTITAEHAARLNLSM